jgi:hypothetical protein
VATVGIDAQTGSLVVNGQKVFPLGLSDAPPVGSTVPVTGQDAWAEIASGGVNVVRSGRSDWKLAQIDQQLTQERTRLDAAAAHHLFGWTRLGDTAGNLPAAPNSPNEQLLVRIVDGLKAHPALAVWKGVDEPANPNRPSPIAADGLVRAYNRLKQLDTGHPVVIIQAPLGPESGLVPYRPALDVTGADIYPISYPPGEHTDLPNKDISVVGDMTQKMVQAAGTKPVWMTLQIAWSGVLPTSQHPDYVPRFPTLAEERFMAYQTIVNGARGLVFFGGDLTTVMRPRDAQAGWNWTFWQLVLRPLLVELSSPSVGPALVAPTVSGVQASAADVELTARDDGTFLYVIAVRTSATATNRVTFTHLPRKRNGTPLGGGEVVFEYAQSPLPPPIDPTKQIFRQVAVANDSFADWFGPHDTHVYRFDLRP